MEFIKQAMHLVDEQRQGQPQNQQGGGGYGGNYGSSYQQQYNGGPPQQQYGGGPQQQQYGGPPPPPQVPYPWIARWDEQDRRYIFINEQTGERSWQFPGHNGPGPGYDQRGSYGGGPGNGPPQGYPPYAGQQRYDSYQQGGPAPGSNSNPSQRNNGGGHGMLYAGAGVAAGLAAGAFATHEWNENKEDIDRFEDNAINDVANFPENAARWTGEKVGEVEDIPDDIAQGFDRFGDGVERRFDDAVDDVVDAPENVANWAGEKVGDVERFGDDVGDAYDQGRDDARYDDY